MRIVYLIGNGLDVKLKLKTRYEEFYKNAYNEQEDDPDHIKSLKAYIKDNIKDWADLEKKIGEYSAQVDSEEKYLSLFKDIRSKLATYIAEQKIEFSHSDFERENFINKFGEPFNYLVEGEIAEFDTYISMLNPSSIRVDFITFNYTRTLEALLGNRLPVPVRKDGKKNIEIYKIEHIHGYTDDRFVLGVDNEVQILNESFRSKNLLKTIIKPMHNKEAKHLADNRCCELINAADIICIYGMSIGETDKTWWKYIGENMYNGNKKLIIFWWDNEENLSQLFSDERLNKRDEVRGKFLLQTSLDENKKEAIRDNIYIVYKQEDIFSMSSID